MRRVDLELLVQKAVETRQAGRPLEDDRIEFKSDWPEPHKARQMAGAANALRGEPLVYVIGANDYGEVQAVTDQEPGDWYAQFVKGFGSPAPQLVLNINVAVGEAPGDTVVALQFETDQFPYVMPVKDKPNVREVPIRVGTTTQSADRRQLMRILAPVVASPPTEVVEARVSARLTDNHELLPGAVPGFTGRPPSRQVSIRVHASVFIEHVGPNSVSVPQRTLKADLLVGAQRMALKNNLRVEELTARSVPGGGTGPEPIPPAFGVYAKHGFIVATGPGEFSFSAWMHWSYSLDEESQLQELINLLLEQERVGLEVSFRFAAAEASVILRPALSRIVAPTQPPDFDGQSHREWDLGKWTYNDVPGS